MMAMQLPLWTPTSEWRPTPVSELPSWAGAKRIAVDIETCDPHLKQLGIGVRRDGYMIGLSFAIEDGPKHYLPFRHEGGDNLPEQEVLRYLRDQSAHFTGEMVGANISYDLDYMWEEGLLFPGVKSYLDVQIADPLIYEMHTSYSLAAICERHGIPGKDEQLLKEAASAYGVGAKDGMWHLPARFVGEYAEADADRPLRILRRQEAKIDELDLWDVWRLESDVLPVLVRMRRRGVRIDQDKLAQIEHWSLEQEALAIGEVNRITGCKIAVGDLWSAKALAPAFEAIGVRLGKTAKGQPEINQSLFKSVDHPVAKYIAWARKVSNLRTNFAAGVRQHMVDGRVHCTFNQIARETESGDQKGARYGRLSATDPALQQQPNPEKDPEFAGEWRKIYLPEEGSLWSCNDYSQQEPRWTTHYAAELNLPGAAEAAQAYHDNPDLDNHDFMTNLVYQIGKETSEPAVWKRSRTHAKTIYLGVTYGEGGAKLCDDLGLPTRFALATGRGAERRVQYFDSYDDAMHARMEHVEGYVWRAAGEEGQRILDKFDERAPFIRKAAKRAEAEAKRRGWVRTWGGRRLNFPKRTDGSYDWAHKAFNRVIQGTSADQMKRALVEIDRAGHWLMLQVHDESDNCVADAAEARAIASIMRDVMPARVPFRVDIEIGRSWGELEKVR